MYIPKYFTLSEFINSATAKRYNLDNTPTFINVSNMLNLCRLVLDPTRQLLGSPIYITSGFRSLAVNQKVGGASGSQHLTGCAVDLQCTDIDKLFSILKDNPHIDQLLLETNKSGTKWVHVSITQTGLNPRRYIDGNYKAK